MPFFSISLQKARAGEPKTTFNVGELSPTAGRAVEIRVASNAYKFSATGPQVISPTAFWVDLERLLDRVRELGEPRPQQAAVSPLGEPWSDGTFWSDGTGWTE